VIREAAGVAVIPDDGRIAVQVPRDCLIELSA
jgi:hypothetical protein